MNGLVTGYHGTNVVAAEAIVRDGFRPSRRVYDWLGDGIYFWQDAPTRAWEWAVARYGPDEAAVIRVAVDLAIIRSIERLR